MQWMTRRDQAATAAKRWAEQYPRGQVIFSGSDTDAILQRLIALGDQPDPDDVDAVIGNRSWTELPRCIECRGRSMPAILEIGDPPGDDSNTAWLCEACLAEGLSTVPRLLATPVGGEAVIRTLASRLTPAVLRQVLVDLDDGSADDDGSARLLMARLSQQLETLTGEG